MVKFLLTQIFAPKMWCLHQTQSLLTLFLIFTWKEIFFRNSKLYFLKSNIFRQIVCTILNPAKLIRNPLTQKSLISIIQFSLSTWSSHVSICLGRRWRLEDKNGHFSLNNSFVTKEDKANSFVLILEKSFWKMLILTYSVKIKDFLR